MDTCMEDADLNALDRSPNLCLDHRTERQGPDDDGNPQGSFLFQWVTADFSPYQQSINSFCLASERASPQDCSTTGNKTIGTETCEPYSQYHFRKQPWRSRSPRPFSQETSVLSRTSLMMLTWVDYAFRPLRVAELLAAVSTAVINSSSYPHCQGSEIEQGNSIDPDFRSLCGGFLEVDDRQFVHFVHQGAKVLQDCQCSSVERTASVRQDYRAHEMIAVTCLNYLLSHDPSQILYPGTHLRGRKLSEIQGTPSLYEYAASYWPRHYKIAEARSTSLAGMLDHFLERSFTGTRLCANMSSDMEPKSIHAARTEFLCICARFGFHVLGQTYLEMGVDPNARSRAFGGNTALQLAASNGHNEMVRLLLDKNTTIESSFSDGKTALSLAVEGGHMSTIQLLLDSCANVNLVNRERLSSLDLAAKHGQEESLPLLLQSLEQGDNSIAMIKQKWQSLLLAIETGNKAATRVLLDRCVGIRIHPCHFQKTLDLAAKGGNEDLLCLLMKKYLALEDSTASERTEMEAEHQESDVSSESDSWVILDA